MKSLFELISKHTQSNAVIPLIALASIVLIIVIYITVKQKWIKYAFSGVVFVIGLIVFFAGYNSLLQQSGLNSIVFGTKVIVFGSIGLMFSAILDILDSLSKMFPKNKNSSKKKINFGNHDEEDLYDDFDDVDDLDDYDDFDDYQDDLDEFDDYDEDYEDTIVVDDEKVKDSARDSSTKVIDKKIENTQKIDMSDFDKTQVIDMSKIKKKSDVQDTQKIDIQEKHSKESQDSNIEDTQVIDLKDIK
ncbi:hypothetical protein ACWOAQ_02975 [Helcococcus kunzii]|uniref:hypothetical protein n=1 Tax=Helcococcus kunzii TaxID=40091 RepID=UPI0038A714DA